MLSLGLGLELVSVQVSDIGAAIYNSVQLSGCFLGHIVVIRLCMVIVIIILLKLVVLDVIGRASLKSVLAILLVDDLYNDFLLIMILYVGYLSFMI